MQVLLNQAHRERLQNCDIHQLSITIGKNANNSQLVSIGLLQPSFENWAYRFTPYPKVNTVVANLPSGVGFSFGKEQ